MPSHLIDHDPGIYNDSEDEWEAIQEHWRKNPSHITATTYRPTCPRYLLSRGDRRSPPVLIAADCLTTVPGPVPDGQNASKTSEHAKTK